VNYVVYKGDYYVSSENIFMYKVDPETLETKEKVWAGGIRGLAYSTGESLLAVSKSSKGELRFQKKLLVQLCIIAISISSWCAEVPEKSAWR